MSVSEMKWDLCDICSHLNDIAEVHCKFEDEDEFVGQFIDSKTFGWILLLSQQGETNWDLINVHNLP